MSRSLHWKSWLATGGGKFWLCAPYCRIFSWHHPCRIPCTSFYLTLKCSSLQSSFLVPPTPHPDPSCSHPSLARSPFTKLHLPCSFEVSKHSHWPRTKLVISIASYPVSGTLRSKITGMYRQCITWMLVLGLLSKYFIDEVISLVPVLRLLYASFRINK